MELLSGLLKPIEGVLNRGFEGSSLARSITEEHQGKTLAIYISNPSMSFYLRIQAQRLELIDDFTAEPEASIGGSLLALSRLLNSDAEQTIREHGILVDGDAGFVQAMQTLMAQIRPDPEEQLSKVVGDVAAHQIGRAISDGLNWGRTVIESVTQNFGEFVSEESRDVPTRYEVNAFMSDVEELRDDVDRMIARFDRLKSRS